MKREVDSQYERVKLAINILITCVIIIALIILTRDFITNVNSIEQLSKSAGIFGPIVLVILIGLGILFTPIPSVLLIIAAGYLYGTWEGAIYSYLGHLLAAISTFSIVRKFHIKTKNKRYSKYRKLIDKNKKILYLLYIIPILPISVVSIFSASSKMKFKQFLKIILISFIPVILLFSFFGERISNKNLIEMGIWITGILIVISIVYIIIKRKQKKQKLPKIN